MCEFIHRTYPFCCDRVYEWDEFDVCEDAKQSGRACGIGFRITFIRKMEDGWLCPVCAVKSERARARLERDTTGTRAVVAKQDVEGWLQLCTQEAEGEAEPEPEPVAGPKAVPETYSVRPRAEEAHDLGISLGLKKEAEEEKKSKKGRNRRGASRDKVRTHDMVTRSKNMK
ncbi:hypothetical protein MMC08_000144 [Hypocenomyce scalaris]|nr:hypothetical protein [Hypocenomyce scalaris]